MKYHRAMRMVALLLALAGTAHAESPAELEAKQHFMAGQKAESAARWSEALAEYQKSYSLSKYPALIYKVALCHDQLGQRSEAIAAYEQYLREDPATQRRAGVEDRIAKLKAELAPKPVEAKPIVAEKPAPAEQRTPVYKKWWLWTIVGVVVVGGVAVGLGVGLTQNQIQHEPGWNPDFEIGPPQALVSF